MEKEEKQMGNNFNLIDGFECFQVNQRPLNMPDPGYRITQWTSSVERRMKFEHEEVQPMKCKDKAKEFRAAATLVAQSAMDKQALAVVLGPGVAYGGDGVRGR